MPGRGTRAFLCVFAASSAFAGGSVTLGPMSCRLTPLPDTCSLGFECCGTDNASRDHKYLYTILKARNDIDDVLRGRLARFEPVGALFGADSVVASPISVEVSRRQATMPTGPATLFMGLRVFRVFSIDQKAGMYKMMYALQLRWRDCRLVHSCPSVSINDHGPDHSSFWKPPIFVHERQDDEVQAESHTIHANGTDDFVVNRISEFACTFNFYDLPWDMQRCALTFELPSTRDYFMRLQWSDPAVTSSSLYNNEWEIQEASEWSRLGLPAEDNKLVVQFSLKRKSEAFVKNFISPAIFFYLASWAGLWIDRRAVPARTMMSLLPVLITVNKYTQLSSMLPLLGYPTRLDQFLYSQVIILVFHVLEFALIHYAARSVKHVEGRGRDYGPDGEGDRVDRTVEAQVLSHYCRWRLTVCGVVHRHVEINARWVSPVIYFFTTIWLLYF